MYFGLLRTACVMALLLFCQSDLLALFPTYQTQRLPEHETSTFRLFDSVTDSGTGHLYESLHQENRYGLQVCLLTRRYEGEYVELETVEFEKESFIPIRATRVRKVRGMNVETEVVFQATRAIITVREPELLGGNTTSTVVTIPRGAIALQQVHYALRSMPLKTGDTYNFAVIPLFQEGSKASEATFNVVRGIEEGAEEGILVRGRMKDEQWEMLFQANKNTPLIRSERNFTATDPISRMRLERE